MAYLIVGALGAAVSFAVWLPWRRRLPLTLVRTLLTAALLAGTGLSLWAVHEGLEAAASGAAAGDAFSHIVVH